MRKVGEGRERIVFALRDEPGLVAKVLKEGVEGGDLVHEREFRALRNAAWPDAPIPFLYGMRKTDHGLAQIADAVGDGEGRAGPTLADLVTDGQLAPDDLDALNRFVAALYRSGLAAYDFSPNNLVLGQRASDGAEGFFLVDGFGDRKRFSRKELWSAKNRRFIDEALGKVEQRVGLRWDAAARVFRNAAGPP